MTDKDKIIATDAQKAENPDASGTVGLSIKCRSDIQPAMLVGYGRAVEFMAVWIKLHEPRETLEGGMEFDEIMNRFAENVSRVLMGETGGTG
jgi:hypothetical protein